MNDYFTLCRQNNNDIINIYNCCLKTCINNEDKNSPIYSKVNSICIATCGKIVSNDYIDLYENCLIESKCWDNYFIPSCLEKNKSNTTLCCINKCNLINNDPNLDCVKFCKQYKINGIL